MQTASSLYDVIENGYIVAGDPEIECFVTWNGSQNLNFWITKYDLRSWQPKLLGYENTDSKWIAAGLTLRQAEDRAKQWLANPNNDPMCSGCERPLAEDEQTKGICSVCAEENK